MTSENIQHQLEEYGLSADQQSLIMRLVEKTGSTEVKVTPGSRGTRLPPDWKPVGETKDWTLAQGISRDEANLEYAKFKDYWNSKSGKDATKVDWNATWRNWIRAYMSRRGSQSRKFERHAGELMTA
jgi:hypothetical protein